MQLAFKGLTEILNSLRRLKQIAPSQNLSPAFITELNETFRYTSEVRANARNLVSMLKTTRRPSRKKLIPLLEEVDVGMMEVQTRLEALLEKLV